MNYEKFIETEKKQLSPYQLKRSPRQTAHLQPLSFDSSSPTSLPVVTCPLAAKLPARRPLTTFPSPLTYLPVSR